MNRSGREVPAVVNFEAEPGRMDETVRSADVPRSISNLDSGMGYSRRIEDVPNGYAYCFPGYTRAPGGIFSPSGAITEVALPTSGWTPAWIVTSVRFRDRIHLITQGNQVLILSVDGMSATVDATFPSNFMARGAAVFNNRLYVGGTGGGLVYKDGVTGAWSAVAPVFRSQLVVANWRPLGVPTDVMVGISDAYGFNSIRWCPITADPMVDSNWSAPVRIGADGRYEVRNLVAAPRHVYMLRPDGLYDMDELGARAYNLAPWVEENADHWNGAWGMALGQGVYYGHSQGLAWVPTSGEAQFEPEWASPGWGLPYEGRVRGMAMAGTLHNGWGMIGFWSQSTAAESYICAGRRDPGGSSGSMAYGQASHVWHGAEAVVAGGIQHLRVHTLEWAGGPPRLLIATTGPSDTEVHVFWQSLSKSGTPLQEMLWGGGFVPADHASLFLPADPYDRPSAIKSLLQLEMVTERLNPGSDELKVYASADASTDWALQGTADGDTYTTISPVEVTEGRFIKTRVDAIGAPILRSLDLRAALGVQLREARQYKVILAYDNALRSARGRETADPDARLADLRSLLGRVCYLDDGEAGGPYRVRVHQVMAGERQRLGGAQRAGSNGAEGAWAIVVPIVVSILDHPFRWDGPEHTDRFDRDRTWA